MVDVRRFHDGDRRLFRALVVEHGPRVLRLTRSFAEDDAAAEDLLQDIWQRVWEHRRSYTGTGSFVGWLLTVARHECVSRYRKEVSRRRTVDRLRVVGATDDLVSPIPSPSRGVELAELRARLSLALTNLTERQRMAVELRFLEDLGSDEAAARMGCEPATVRSLVRHGMARLRTILNEESEQYEVSGY